MDDPNFLTGTGAFNTFHIIIIIIIIIIITIIIMS